MSGRPAALRVLDRSIPAAASAGCVWIQAPRWVLTTAVAVSLALTLSLVFRRWGGGLTDRVVVLAGGFLATTILLGVLLDLLPGGLTTGSWVVAAAVVGVAVVIATRDVLLLPVGLGALCSTISWRASWYTGGVVLVALAFWLSIAAEVHSEKAPVALSVQSENAGGTMLAITSGSPAGPLSLIEVSGGHRNLLRSDLMVAAGHPLLVSIHPPSGEILDVRLVKSGPSGQGQVANLMLAIP